MAAATQWSKESLSLYSPFLQAGTDPADTLLSNQTLWFALGVTGIALISLIIAYRSRNAAYKLAQVQGKRLRSLNEQLRRKSRELSETNVAKDQLISVISHDLRAPLASLDSCLEIMLTEDLTQEEKDELMRDLQKETYNTLKTLDDLLAWARLQQSGGKNISEAFDIVALCKEVMTLYRMVANHKEISLEYQGSEDEVEVQADPNQIRTVLRNLISNAIKFTPDNGVVRVAVSSCDKGVEVSVQDEGRGISAEEMEKIKDPSNYYSSKGTAGENGTGVGLKLSFEFLANHDTTLEFTPALPNGTRASFHLKSKPESSAAKSA